MNNRGSTDMNPAQLELARQLGVDNAIEHDYWGTAPYLIDDQYHMYIGEGKLKGFLLQVIDIRSAQRLRSISLTDKVQAPQDSRWLFSIPDVNRLSMMQGLQYLDTSMTTNMAEMFADDSELEELTGIEHWDVRQVVDMYRMFHRTYVHGLDLSHWNTRSLTDIQGMFQESKLKSLDVSHWDLRQVISLDNVFQGANFLKQINGLSDWDTSHVRSMRRTFFHTHLLESLDINDWDVSQVTDFHETFASSGLSRLDLSNWDVSQATDLERMFGVMYHLERIDLRNWRLSHANRTDQMFINDQRLTHILINDWGIPRTASTKFMFHMCNQLKKK